MTMKELIGRLKAATGPDRKLDEAIDEYAVTLLGLPPRVVPPPYTASIDAALTLVPDGEDWHMQSHASVAACWASVGRFTRGPMLWKHATPAIALCIAALRARAVA
jgi:hypothetical protein